MMTSQPTRETLLSDIEDAIGRAYDNPDRQAGRAAIKMLEPRRVELESRGTPAGQLGTFDDPSCAPYMLRVLSAIQSRPLWAR